MICSPSLLRAANCTRRAAPLALAAILSACGPLDDDPETVGAASQPLSFMPSLPYPSGLAMGVSQGWGGTWSHSGNLYYAIDFNLPGTADLGVHVLAVADGTVTYRYDECTCDGCSCNGGWGNAIVIDHGSGEFSKYTHLITASIPSDLQVGSQVCRGLHVGDIGSTGNSTGSHLHFQFQSDGTLNGPSIPFDRFDETGGVPQEGGSYTSSNTELSVCGPPQPCSITVGTGVTIIDDETDCFDRTGTYWWEESYGHDGHHWYTYTIDESAAESTGTWEVNVDVAGDYQVEVFVPDNADALTTSVPYTLRHGGQQSDRTIDQAAHRGQWVELGTLHFASGGDQFVRIFDNTGEAYVDASGPRLLLDAVRFTQVGSCTEECTDGSRCGGDGYQECGNYDGDPCLEWGGGGACPTGTHCESEGVCSPDNPDTEGGIFPDGGTWAEAGSEGGTWPESGAPTEAGTEPDAGSGATWAGEEEGEGCACRTGQGRTSSAAWWSLIGLGLLYRLRRRRVSSGSSVF